MKTITLIPTILAITLQLTVNSQTTTNKINNVSVDKINLHVVQQSKKSASYKVLPILGAVKKQAKVLDVTTTFSFNELILKAEELTNQAKMVKEHALKLNDDNKIMQLEIATELQQQALIYQIKASEISFQNTLSEFAFNKLEFLQLLNSVPQLKDVITNCNNKHNDAERNLRLAKEMRQEAYNMPSLAGTLGTMSNAEEKEYLALQKQNQAIEQLKTIVLNSLGLKQLDVCIK